MATKHTNSGATTGYDADEEPFEDKMKRLESAR